MMRVLVVGGGGREQAIAWACAATATRSQIAADLGDASPATVDLVILGPEAALDRGHRPTSAPGGRSRASDPTAELARLESSKGYSRELAETLGIPGPPTAGSTRREPAIEWFRSIGRSVVVKHDGLAAGKGVIVPADDDETIEAIRTTAALGPFVLEERLHGPECSLLALCDGTVGVRFRSPRTTSASARATPARTPAGWVPTPRLRCRTAATSWWRRSSSRSSTTSPPLARRTSACCTRG